MKFFKGGNIWLAFFSISSFSSSFWFNLNVPCSTTTIYYIQLIHLHLNNEKCKMYSIIIVKISIPVIHEDKKVEINKIELFEIWKKNNTNGHGTYFQIICYVCGIRSVLFDLVILVFRHFVEIYHFHEVSGDSYLCDFLCYC